jgi:hypothetical protein
LKQTNKNKERHNKMSETQKEVLVERNGISFPFTWTSTGKKHKNPGVAYPMPLLKPSQLQTDENARTWYGDMPDTIINRYFRAVYADIALDNFDEATGEINWATWTDAASEPNAGRTKIADLEAEVAEQIDITTALTDKVFTMMENDSENPEIATLQSQIQNILKNVVKPLRLKIADIKAKYDKIVAAREAKKVAEPVTA